jgi:hypothetical protein
MIRSIGSSLLAKAGSGSLTRKKEETRMTKPEVPGKGAVGTAVRDLTQETNITPTAPGSEKVIRSAPGMESASLPGMAANQVPLVAGMGLPVTPGAGAPGGGAPASAPGQAGRQAVMGASTGAPVGSVAAARAAGMTAAPTMGAVSKAAAERIPFGGGSLPDIGMFGARVSADTGGNAPASTGTPGWQPTAGQYAAGALGKVINAVGQKLGNILPELKVSEKLQNWGGSPGVALAGQGSIGKTVQNISNALRSVTQAAKNTFSNLRSKIFGR